jgi:putative phage-type endonuclease
VIHDEAWHAARRLGIGGSDANTIAAGDPEKVLRLIQEKRGEVEPEDLSRVLPVRMGSFTEPFNIQWLEESTGLKVTGQGDTRVSSEHPWMRCNLDGETVLEDGLKAIVEAKHCSAFAKEEEVTQRYFAQLQHCMHVCGYERAILSVFFGTFTWKQFLVHADPLYQAQLIDQERKVWRCVETGEMPPIAHVPAPVEPIRKVDMTGNNAFAASANVWLSNKGYAKAFEKAAKDLKSLVEPDAVEAFGYGIVVSRSKSGSLTIRERD